MVHTSKNVRIIFLVIRQLCSISRPTVSFIRFPVSSVAKTVMLIDDSGGRQGDEQSSRVVRNPRVTRYVGGLHSASLPSGRRIIVSWQARDVASVRLSSR